MVKLNSKNHSKRVGLKKKYKIIRKVKDHHRKLRKEKKKNPKKFLRKDPGVPNSLPFKEDVYKHIDETRQIFNEIKKKQFLARIEAKKSEKVDVKIPSKMSVSLAGEFKKVIKESDIIIQVLDARDPNGTRCPEAEMEVASQNKKLVLLINKIDLVPGENVLSWLKYFRQWYATLPFKANTQEQNKNLKVSKDSWKKNLGLNENFKKTHAGIGVEALMALLGSYARHMIPMGQQGGEKNKNGSGAKLVVGFIGLPNTGKSAIVNTLKRKHVSASSNIPGLTRIAQQYRLSDNLFLYDSPGIVPSASVDESEKALKNCMKPEDLEDPISVVEVVLRRLPIRQMMVKYGISEYASPTDFLLQLAQKRGLLRKGGVCNTRQAALTLIRDWITGRITYHTLPPENDTMDQSKQPETIAIDNLDLPLQEFDQNAINSVFHSRDKEVDFCPDAIIKESKPMETAMKPKLTFMSIEGEEDDESEEDEDESEEDDDESGSEEDEDFEDNNEMN